MDNIILVGLVFIVFCIILGLLKKKKKYQESDTTQIIEKNIVSSVVAGKKSSNSARRGSIMDQVQNPLIKEKKKIVQWQESESYEKDLKKLSEEEIIKEKMEEEIVEFVENSILVVDDSVTVRRYIENLLKNDNYKIILKNDGSEALEYLRMTKLKPDLIITDIQMPNMDGFELIENIREIKRYENMPILVISANAENHIILMEKESIQGFIQKPFEDHELISQVKYLLGTI